MLDLQTIKSYVLHFETLEIKSSGSPISLPCIITRKYFPFTMRQHLKRPCKQYIQRQYLRCHSNFNNCPTLQLQTFRPLLVQMTFVFPTYLHTFSPVTAGKMCYLATDKLQFSSRDQCKKTRISIAQRRGDYIIQIYNQDC